MARRISEQNRRMSRRNQSGIRRGFALNIGTIIFGILFIYIAASVVILMSANHIASYRVTSGPLAKNQTYTGLAIRSERVVTTDTSGYVTYYAAENSKVKKKGVIFGISSQQLIASDEELDEKTLRNVKDQIISFTGGFDQSDFYETYSLKYQIEGTILNTALGDLTDMDLSNSFTVNGQTVNISDSEGIVLYSTDGYENVDISNFDGDLLDEKAYSFTALKTTDRVNAGDPVYKLVNSEDWSLIIPLTAKQIAKLDTVDRIKVKFLKDGATETAAFTIFTDEDGSYYGKLDFSTGLIRYIGSRFLRVELVTNTQTGLKIPVSSVTEKEFYTVPSEYMTYGGDSNDSGFMKMTTNPESGQEEAVFIKTTIYDEENNLCYIDSDDFSVGDIIVKPDSNSDRFIVRETASLEGVYNINKGYAIFRRVEMIERNEDYILVKEGTNYGINEFDNIVLDSSKVKESQITAS
ncbi:MAG: HlyD family efflux transporter periplasmic adaptor subunit [Lachnospiraceae bacterium]|nr:HlyD family efflux transporter periplasmic adaptor subunit [Lachnospiraceae bacterium]